MFVVIWNQSFKFEIKFYWFEIKVLGLNLLKKLDCMITMSYINVLIIIPK
jgi:hypothetical protein